MTTLVALPTQPVGECPTEGARYPQRTRTALQAKASYLSRKPSKQVCILELVPFGLSKGGFSASFCYSAGTMQFNERKLQALEIFSHHVWMRPRVWAVEAGFYPTRSSYSYLVRLHRWAYLKRNRDYRGRVIYRLGRRGAQWLLDNRRAMR